MLCAKGGFRRNSILLRHGDKRSMFGGPLFGQAVRHHSGQFGVSQRPG